MPTGAVGAQTRDYAWQLVHSLRMTVNFASPNKGTGVPFASMLPAGARILFALVKVRTAFDDGAVLTVGTNSSAYDNIVAAADVDETLTQAAMVLTGADLEVAASAYPYAKVSATPTVGEADITIVYAVNR